MISFQLGRPVSTLLALDLGVALGLVVALGLAAVALGLVVTLGLVVALGLAAAAFAFEVGLLDVVFLVEEEVGFLELVEAGALEGEDTDTIAEEDMIMKTMWKIRCVLFMHHGYQWLCRLLFFVDQLAKRVDASRHVI